MTSLSRALSKPGAKRPATTAADATGWELHQKLKTIHSSLPGAAWQQSHLNKCKYGWGWKMDENGWWWGLEEIPAIWRMQLFHAVSSSSFLFVALPSKSFPEYCSNINGLRSLGPHEPSTSHGPTALKTLAEPVPGRRFAHLHHLGVENV